jgi:hypothetical protein
VIGGRAVLPTVCAVAWMVNACEQLYPGYTFRRVDDYRALKGIVFDDEAVDQYVLDLKVHASEPQDDTTSMIQADAMIWSQTPGGLPRYHYRSQVTLGRAVAKARDIAVGSSYAGGLTDESYTPEGRSSRANLYEDGTLFHGPSFRGITEILSMDEGGLTMTCRLPAISPAAQGQFPVQTFNPYVVDVQLQSLLVWARHHIGYGGLPLRIGSGVQHKATHFGDVTTTSMSVISSGPRHLVADVVARDGNGDVCVEVRGAEITLSERLNALFTENRLTTASSDPDESSASRNRAS